MSWRPPDTNQGIPLRERLPEAGWRAAIVEIAEAQGLGARELEPYARGERLSGAQAST